MNSAKRISNQTIKNDNLKTDKDKGTSSQTRKKGIIISAICGVVVLFLVVMVLWENLHPKLIFTINGEKVEFEQEDAFNGLPISTPPYTICPKCQHNKCVPLDYKSKRGYHHKYKK